VTAEPEAERLDPGPAVKRVAANAAPGDGNGKEIKAAKSGDADKSAPAFPRWVRSVNDYTRRETTVVEGSRYG
jgi:hypothetical protein